MYEATDILIDTVERLFKLCDALLPVNHAAALRVESLGIEVEGLVKASGRRRKARTRSIA